MLSNTQDIPLTKSGKPDKRYRSKNNTPSIPEIIDKLIPDTTKLTREEKLILNLYKGQKPCHAADNAGYGPSMGESSIYTKLKTSSFRKKFKDFAVNHNVLLLAKVAQIDEAILDKLAGNPDTLLDDYAKVKDVPKRIQQVAGILKDTAPAQLTIPIQINLGMQVMVGQDIGLDDDVIDVTPEDAIDV